MNIVEKLNWMRGILSQQGLDQDKLFYANGYDMVIDTLFIPADQYSLNTIFQSINQFIYVYIFVHCVI